MTETMFEPGEAHAEDAKWRGASELRRFLVPVESLKSFPGNPPRSEQHIYQIAKSLREFGQVRAILTWENAEEFGLPTNTIVGGHHVWHAAQSDELKWTHVAAIPAHFSSMERASDYLALDNLLSVRTEDEIADQLSMLSAKDSWSDPRVMEVAKLKLHERSVRQDPDEVIEHLAANLREVGFLDKVIVARDGTILVGESVLRAAALAGIDKIPVQKVNIDPDSPEALRIMAADYSTGKRAMVDDRAYAELLRQIQEDVGTLEGTGYDTDMLAGLLLMTRTAAEVRDINEAHEWIGLSEYESVKLPSKLIISFEDDEERELFMVKNGMPVVKRTLASISAWYPPREGRGDPGSLRFADSTRKQYAEYES